MTLEEISGATGVSVPLLRAMMQVESGGNVRAVRFERRLFAQRGGDVSGLPRGTGREVVRAALARDMRRAVESVSWGRWQVLGGHLLAMYGGDPRRAVEAFESAPGEIGDRMLLAWFRANPRALAAARVGDVEALALRYNGAPRWGVAVRARMLEAGSTSGVLPAVLALVAVAVAVSVLA